MKRREFIAGLACATAWPIAAWPQQRERMRRVGLLTHFSESDPEAQTRINAFRNALQELGWVPGKKEFKDRLPIQRRRYRSFADLRGRADGANTGRPA
jgi:putative ABC transport system substrate-binding protein